MDLLEIICVHCPRGDAHKQIYHFVLSGVFFYWPGFFSGKLLFTRFQIIIRSFGFSILYLGIPYIYTYPLHPKQIHMLYFEDKIIPLVSFKYYFQCENI
jgi:hypothetical protein